MSEQRLETATLGGGCFWCLEAVYQELQGVRRVRSGYAGGHAADPTYRQVCSGNTGHAEVVQVDFDPDEISFREVLEVFFTIHDPTTPNRQGADVGTQYRSIVLYHSPEQREEVERVIEELRAEGAYGGDPIVTEIEPLERFWSAEAEHDDYYRRNPEKAYCQAVIDPKLAKFRETFTEKRRSASS